MIARNRPETRLHEIVRACLKLRSASTPRFNDTLARTLAEALAVDGNPLLVPSGRAALFFLFKALPLRRVYLPAYTCWVVLEAAKLAGKDVAFVDIDYPSMNMSLEQLDRIAVEPGIVLATHQFGYPEDVEAIERRLSGRGHVIIEDCAGAMLCSVRGTVVGNRGAAAIFSLEAGKLLTVGRGGLIVTRDEALAARLREAVREAAPSKGYGVALRVAGKRLVTSAAVYGLVLALYLRLREPTEGMHPLATELGEDYRDAFSALQGSIASVLLGRLQEIGRRRRALFDLYQSTMESMTGFTRVPALPGSEITPIRYPILVQGRDKRSVYDFMRARGVDLGFSYSYSLASPEACPNAARFAAEVLNLPLYADLPLSAAERLLSDLRSLP